MKKLRFLMMAFTLLFAISIPTQLVAQNKKLIKEAKDGNGEAQAMLSTYYFKGIEGFDRDIEQAKFWAGKAEESAENPENQRGKGTQGGCRVTEAKSVSGHGRLCQILAKSVFSEVRSERPDSASKKATISSTLWIS